MKILFKFPSRSRPEKFFAALDNIIENALNDDYLIVCSLDSDDATMNNQKVFDKIITYEDKVTAIFSKSLNKVDAVNRNIGTILNWDILCLHSDDMVFTKKGFDLDIINSMQRIFADTDGILHFPDGHANETLITYPIIGRKYFERFGYIYNPIYNSLFCDNEQMEVAQKLGKYAYIDEHIFEHRHPVWGFGQYDEQLKRTQKFWDRDKRIYNQRKAINFGL